MNLIIKGSDGSVSHIVVDGVDVTDLVKRFRIEFSSTDNHLIKLKCDLDYEMFARGAIKSIVEEFDSE